MADPVIDPKTLQLRASLDAMNQEQYDKGERKVTESSRLRRSSQGNFGLGGYDSDEEEEEVPEIKSLWWTTLLVRHPFLVHFVVMCFAFMCVFLSMEKTELSRIAAESLLPDGNKWCDDIRAMQSITQSIFSKFTMPQSAPEPYLYTQFFFALTPEEQDKMKKNGETPWILTPDRMKTIAKYENKYILENKKWLDLCYLEPGLGRKVTYSTDPSICDGAVTSLVQVYAGMLNYDYDAMTTEGIKAFVQLAMGASSETATLFDPMVQRKVNHSNNMSATFYRSIFKAAMPYPTTVKIRNITLNETTGEWVETVNKTSTYKHKFDRVREQQIEGIIDDFGMKAFQEVVIDENAELVDNGMRIRNYNAAVWLHYNNVHMVNSIAILYFIAITVILFYTTYDIGSLFLSMAALWEIVATVPIAWFCYRIVLDIPQLGGLNFSILFVLFSVGVYYHPAYVFVDHWMQSKHIVEDPNDYEKRMAIAWKSSAAAVGIAQSTTFVSFLSGGIGTIMWFRSFGIWAGLAILVNYLLGITLYPCSIILWELYARPVETALTDWLTGRGFSRISFRVAEKYHARYLKQKSEKSASSMSFTTNLIDVEPLEGKKAEKTIDVGYGPQTYLELKEEYRPVGFYLGVFWPGILWKIRYVAGTILLAWAVWSCYCCTQLERLSEAEAYHGKDSFFYKSQHESNNFAYGDSDRNGVVLIAGIEGLKDGSRNEWDAFDYGEPVWLDNLDLSDVSAQKYLRTICKKLQKAKHLIDDPAHVYCWIDDFEPYVTRVLNTTYPIEGMNQKQFNEVLYDFLYNSEEGLPLSNLAKMKVVRENNEYRLKFFNIVVRSKYLFWSSQQEADSDRLNWIIMEEDLNKECVDSVKDGKNNPLCKLLQVSLRWGFTESYEQFTLSAIQACILTLPLVFVILILVLQNWIIATLCVINVLFVMVSCLSVIQMSGWKFGIVECCAVILCLGFSVDYCVHLAHGYISSPVASDRAGRVRYALLTTGHAITSSALLSFVATLPLFVGADYAMFAKIGILTVCTIVYSEFLSFTFFTLLLLLAAPRGKVGFIPIQKYICRCVCLKQGHANFSKNAEEEDV